MVLILIRRYAHCYYRQIPLFIRALCLFLLFVACFAQASDDDSYNKGAYYFSRGYYLSALNMWAPLADQGQPLALYSIALLYEQGKGVNKDPERALKYFKSAAAQTLPEAQYYLAMKYYLGKNVKLDLHKARQLLLQAAEQDYLPAQFQLAKFYAQGKGGAKDQQQAIFWLTKASESGYGVAQHALAARFLMGRGTTISLQKGIFWLTKAAEQNDSNAMRDLAYMHIQGMGVKKDYQRAVELLLTPAEEGSGLALFLLGEINANGGYGVDKDLPAAKKWYQHAVKKGYKAAAQRLQQLNKTKTKTTNSNQLKKSSENLFAQDRQRIMRLDDKQYLLQIISARHLSSITKLTRQYSDTKTYMLHISKVSGSQYVLCYGPYKNRREASSAINRLPKIFQLKSKPWIRSAKSIKAAL